MAVYPEDTSRPLSPPRPPFHTHARRSSLSDDRNSTSSLEPNSDSDRDQPRPPSTRPLAARKTPRNHRRTSQLASYSSVHQHSQDPLSTDQPDTWSPSALYDDANTTPPSSFFPFQSHPGNPDPLPTTLSRRSSTESISIVPRATTPNIPSVPRSSSGTDLRANAKLARPNPRFIPAARQGTHRDSAASMSDVYRNSAPGIPYNQDLPRNSSIVNFRAPFLSPASRPTSSLWSPPAYPGFPNSPSASATAFPPVSIKKSPAPSTRLKEKLSPDQKPWLGKKDKLEKLSWWITFCGIILGIAGAAYLCYSGWTSVLLLPDSELCLVMDDDFNSFDTNNWNYDVEASGFGNGEFQMTTDSSNNTYTSNSQLYIVPTLSSDAFGTSAIFNGYNYTLPGCTTSNTTACSVSSNADTNAVIPPVMSARINTQSKATIKFGKVEVRAKLPQGDWLWPAIWMLPDNSVYGEWPLSGEIDIMEARGNLPTYAAQGSNYVRSSLNFGPLASLYTSLYGWLFLKQGNFASDFHVYSIEWTGEWIRFYTDSQLQTMMTVKMGSGSNNGGGSWFWKRGDYPATAWNGTANGEVVVQDPWTNGTWAAPYDQNFYMVLDLAVGGTSGWFPDGVGNKPWYDASLTAMTEFAYAQDTWAATWPGDVDDLAFRIDYVKMWQLCPSGTLSKKRR